MTIPSPGNIFGKIIHGEMQLNANGSIADKCWKEIPRHFQNVELDEYVIMPNHIHGIIILHDHSRDVQLNVPTRLSPRKGTLSVIIRTFKAAVTTECHNNSANSKYTDH
jgi:REP element-mobilizing transposase RayT